MLVKKHPFAKKQKKKPSASSEKQYSKTAWQGKVENLENSLLTVGAFCLSKHATGAFHQRMQFH